MAEIVEVVVPASGESVTEADIGELLVKIGDVVKVDDPLISLETDKAAMDVSAPVAGAIQEIRVAQGDTVNVGDVMVLIAKGGTGNTAAPAKAAPKKAALATVTSSGKIIEVVVPASGESVTEADIGELMVKVGDSVQVDDPLVALETDKAAMDVPAPVTGSVKEIKVSEGETVNVGDVIMLIAEGAAGNATNAAAASAPAPTPSTANGSAPISPAPRRVIEEHSLDASQIVGSGKGGRITKGDALAALSTGNSSATPVAARAKEIGPREERVKMSRMRQTIARNLKASQNEAAMLTTFNDVDMTAIMETRSEYKELFLKKHGVKLGFMSFFIKACVAGLKEIREVNAQIDGTDIIYKDHYDISVAVGTDKGLLVPVLRDADRLSLAGIERRIADFGARARSGDISMDEMQGGTFTISNGGVYGSLMSMPILNAPQSGILGMHRIEKRPVVIDGAVVVRPMMYLALSYDHRIVDGKGAVTFLVKVKENLEDPGRLLLDL